MLAGGAETDFFNFNNGNYPGGFAFYNSIDSTITQSSPMLMRILGNGNVGIGKPDPAVALDVSGQVSCNSLKVGTSGSVIKLIQHGSTTNSSSSTITVVFPNRFTSIPTVVTTLCISRTDYFFKIVLLSVTVDNFQYRIYGETITNPSQTFGPVADQHTVNWIAMN
jgi:hypothetical protein